MAEHEIVKRAFLNKTPAREDFFVFSVSNIVDVLPGQVITEDQVKQLFADGVDVTINLPMPPPGAQAPAAGGPQFREVQPTGEKKPCTTCGKKKAEAENIVEEESSVEVAEVTE